MLKKRATSSRRRSAPRASEASPLATPALSEPSAPPTALRATQKPVGAGSLRHNEGGAAAGPRIPAGPSREAIAAGAYALFLKRGGTHGHDREDWLQAEAELWAEQESLIGHA